MVTPGNFSASVRWVLATSLIAMLPACGTTRGLSSAAPGARLLPPVADIVSAPAARPAAKAGEDARLYARRALDYGDENAAALTDAADRYRALAEAMARPKPEADRTTP